MANPPTKEVTEPELTKDQIPPPRQLTQQEQENIKRCESEYWLALGNLYQS